MRGGERWHRGCEGGVVKGGTGEGGVHESVRAREELREADRCEKGYVIGHDTCNKRGNPTAGAGFEEVSGVT